MVFPLTVSERDRWRNKWTEKERRGEKKRDGRKIERRQHGGLITQRGTRGEIDERKGQRALAKESIVGEKDARYSLCTKYRRQRGGSR